MTQAYPLAWPDGFPRTPERERKPARFSKFVQRPGAKWTSKTGLTIADARSRLIDELIRLGASHPVISSNLRTRNDGLPRSDARNPDDPGVAVYFQLDGRPHCMPCDRWDRCADNMAAIAATIDAQRGIARWGVGDVARSFAGFAALPPPMTTPAPRSWRKVLGILDDEPIDEDALAACFRDAAKAAHPDHGGSDSQMAAVNLAYEQAKVELGFQVRELGYD